MQSTGASWVRIPQLVTHRNRNGSTPASILPNVSRTIRKFSSTSKFNLQDRLQLHKHVADAKKHYSPQKAFHTDMLTKLFEAEYFNPTPMSKKNQVAKRPYRFCANLSKIFATRSLLKSLLKLPKDVHPFHIGCWYRLDNLRVQRTTRWGYSIHRCVARNLNFEYEID